MKNAIEIVNFPNKTSIYHGFMMIIPSGKLTVCELEHDHLNVVDLPIENGNFP